MRATAVTVNLHIADDAPSPTYNVRGATLADKHAAVELGSWPHDLCMYVANPTVLRRMAAALEDAASALEQAQQDALVSEA